MATGIILSRTLRPNQTKLQSCGGNKKLLDEYDDSTYRAQDSAIIEIIQTAIACVQYSELTTREGEEEHLAAEQR